MQNFSRHRLSPASSSATGTQHLAPGTYFTAIIFPAPRRFTLSIDPLGAGNPNAIANSQNGLFLGYLDRESGTKEIYTFVTNDMMKADQMPDQTDEFLEAITGLCRKSRRRFNHQHS